MKKKGYLKTNKDLVIYQTKNGAIEFRGDFRKETIWATQAQIAELFGVKRPAITKHLKNIFGSGELNEKAVCSILEHTANDGKVYKTQYYNLDAIISVGYRINSKTATEFRKWATKTLREYLIKGFVLNKRQIKRNYNEFLKTIENIKNLLPEDINISSKSILDLVKEFSFTWITIDQYDREILKPIGKTKKQIKLTGIELQESIQKFKLELLKNGGATEIFAQERERGGIEGIVGNIMQTFEKKDLYQTLEDKASHLLYFMVKNHPFVDGNKRSGAFAFIWFLKKSGVKGLKNINPGTLTAMTLLIAESKPEKKEQMINLIINLLEIDKNK